MLLFSIIILALLCVGLVFSIVQVGLLAYSVNVFLSGYTVEYYCGAYEVCSETVGGYVPDSVALLMFCSIWSMLVTAFAIGLSQWYHRRNGHHHNSWLAPLMIVLFFLNWVFWLAGFADLVYVFGGTGLDTITACILALAIILWLLYMTLFILSFLTIFGVVAAEFPGFLAMRGHAANTDHEITETPAFSAAPAEPKYDGNHELTA